MYHRGYRFAPTLLSFRSSSKEGAQGPRDKSSSAVHEEYLHLDDGGVEVPSVRSLPKNLDHYLYIYFHITILMDFAEWLLILEECR